MKVRSLPRCDCKAVLGQEASCGWSCHPAEPGPKWPRDNRAGMCPCSSYSLSYICSQRSVCPSRKLSSVIYRARGTYPRAALYMLITHKKLMTSWDGTGSRQWKWQVLRVQREGENWLSLPECLKGMHNKVVRIWVHWSSLSSALLVPQHSQDFSTKP